MPVKEKYITLSNFGDRQTGHSEVNLVKARYLFF